MDLARFPRRRYTAYETPIEFLPNLTRALGGPDLYIKRDDLLEGAGGGNKTRKLEFLMADALAQGADTILTCGAVQSNHCRLTLSAAVKEGLKCQLVLEERVPGTYREDASGNIFLMRLLGAEAIHVISDGRRPADVMEQVAEELRRQGRKPYIIPGGGSDAIGGLGYVACAQETLHQTYHMGLALDHVFCACGSTGTYAGLLVGFHGANAHIPVTGVSVSRKEAELAPMVAQLAGKLAEELGISAPLPDGEIRILDGYVGPGYSLPAPSTVETVRLLARTESILLDPVYTGKTMDGLIDQIRQGRFRKGEKVLFVHTGGWPALFAYMEETLKEG